MSKIKLKDFTLVYISECEIEELSYDVVKTKNSRPYLILRKNFASDYFLACPLTSTVNEYNRYSENRIPHYDGLGKLSFIKLDCIKVISKEYLEILSETTINKEKWRRVISFSERISERSLKSETLKEVRNFYNKNFCGVEN